MGETKGCTLGFPWEEGLILPPSIPRLGFTLKNGIPFKFSHEMKQWRMKPSPFFTSACPPNLHFPSLHSNSVPCSNMIDYVCETSPDATELKLPPGPPRLTSGQRCWEL